MRGIKPVGHMETAISKEPCRLALPDRLVLVAPELQYKNRCAYCDFRPEHMAEQIVQTDDVSSFVSVAVLTCRGRRRDSNVKRLTFDHYRTEKKVWQIQ